MRILLAAICMLAAMAAAAADRGYAVMSLVGDGITVVQHRSSAGSSLSDRSRDFLPFDERVFDRGALRAVEAGIHHADPSARVVLLGGRDAKTLAAQKDALGTPALAQAVADAIRPRLPDVGATQLVLLLKNRHPAALPYTDGEVQAGELEGLGFYIDPTLVTHRGDSGGAQSGYFAPYAEFELALVDLASGKVLAEKAVSASHAYESDTSKALKPWESMSSAEKVEALQRLLANQAETAATALIAAH